MRVGVNPEKLKGEKNKRYFHRIIIPVYIPNNEEVYYVQSIDVLDACLNSLTQTINFDTTAITLINNNSNEFLIGPVLEKYKKYIDKLVNYIDNKGKVYAVLSEAKASYETFVTIADADVLFYSGWEQAVFDIFKCYKKAGVVSPLPSQYVAFHENLSLFYEHYLFGKMKYDKIVNDVDVDLYIRGLNNTALINKKGKFNWKEKQYYLNGNTKAIVGATHFVSTYRSFIFRDETLFPEIKFKNGYETSFIDVLADKNGLYRLSTLKTFAYHIGNKMDSFSENNIYDPTLLLDSNIFREIKELKAKRIVLIPRFVKKIYFKILRRLKLL